MDEANRQVVGRDELNLAEFPVTALTERVPAGVKTLTFRDRDGTLTVVGSDDLGLPTAPDADVIVGLLHLTKLANDFTDPTVSFSRYELMDLMGWSKDGRQYRRLETSLHRWVGVTLRYERTWWDIEARMKMNASFHILDSVVLFDQDLRRKFYEQQQTLPLSTATWGKDFFRSCRTNNLKRLDLDVYFRLRTYIGKRLYRFLDKRFHVGDEWIFNLRELAFDHIGMSRTYTDAKIREKLRPALEELQAIGYIRPPAYEKDRDRWRVRFRRQ